MAGIDTSHVKYVKPGTEEQDYINIDTGNKHGVAASLNRKTAFIDHHSEGSLGDTSATEITYKALTKLGLLEGNPVLQKAVKLITQEDNRSFPNEEKYFKDHWHDTLLGLARYIKFEQLVKAFEAGKTSTDVLTQQELKKLGLEKISNRVKGWVHDSIRDMEKLKQQGLVLHTKNYGDIAVDIGKKVSIGFLAAKQAGMGGYVIWNPDSRSFFVSTKKPLKVKFGQGRKIRQTMWIKPQFDSEPLKIGLSDIVSALNNGSLENLEPGLQRSLDRDIARAAA